MFVTPAEGLKVQDPFKKDFLPAEGREVPDGDLYWIRLLRDGDVIEGPPVVAQKTQTAKASPTLNKTLDNGSAQ